MQKVAIVTGSGHGLPEKLAKEYNINLYHFGISIGNNNYVDSVDITPDKLLKIIYDEKINPKSSAPSPLELANIFKTLKEEGKSIVAILMSSKLSSATLEAAKKAKENVGGDIEIIDSLQIAPGKELIVLEAAKLAKEGKSKEEVVACTKKVISRTNSIYGVPDLMYLYRSGRIGRAKVLMGSAMKVIPIIAVRDMEGSISPVGRARNMFQVNEKIVENIKMDLEKFKASKVKSLVVSHADNKEAAQQLRELIEKNIECQEILEMEFGCVAIVHPGPKTWGAAYYIE